jgi:hypothetical protein
MTSTQTETPVKYPPTGTDADFVFTHDGTEFRLPPGTVLSMGFARKIRHLSEADQIFTILEEMCIGRPDVLEAIDDMHAAEFNEWNLNWQKHNLAQGQATLGESKA